MNTLVIFLHSLRSMAGDLWMGAVKRTRPSSTIIIEVLGPGQLRLALILIALLLVGVSGCAPAGQAAPTASTAANPTPPTEAPSVTLPTTEATMPPGWETYSNSRFHYSFSYPPGMEGDDNGDYSWMLGVKSDNPGEGARNFIYVSVIPTGFQGSSGDIYNYNAAETEILLNMQAGESKSLHEGSSVEGFTYTRMMDTILNGQAARLYENAKPWEFPEGTKEIRYYLQTEAYTYLLGAYVDTTGSDQPGAITEDLFNQIAATFQVTP